MKQHALQERVRVSTPGHVDKPRTCWGFSTEEKEDAYGHSAANRILAREVHHDLSGHHCVKRLRRIYQTKAGTVK